MNRPLRFTTDGGFADGREVTRKQTIFFQRYFPIETMDIQKLYAGASDLELHISENRGNIQPIFWDSGIWPHEKIITAIAPKGYKVKVRANPMAVSTMEQRLHIHFPK
jgi:hypothetical protein